MTCDYCGKSLTIADKPCYAPHGLPLFVCNKCYEQLKESKEEDDGSNDLIDQFVNVVMKYLARRNNHG